MAYMTLSATIVLLPAIGMWAGLVPVHGVVGDDGRLLGKIRQYLGSHDAPPTQSCQKTGCCRNHDGGDSRQSFVNGTFRARHMGKITPQRSIRKSTIQFCEVDVLKV